MTNDIIILRPDDIQQPNHHIITNNPYPSLDTNPAEAYLLSLGTKSQRVMKDALNKIVQILMETSEPDKESYLYFPWHKINPAAINVVRNSLQEEYSPASAKRMMSALKGVIYYCWKYGYINQEQRARLQDVRPIRGSRSKDAGRALTEDEIQDLFHQVRRDQSNMGKRDLAIMALLRQGLRRAEIAKLKQHHIKDHELHVIGKGNKQRVLPLHAVVYDDLQNWLQIRGRAIFVFTSVTKNDKVSAKDKGLSEDAIYAIVLKRAQQSGIERFTPHDMRRTFASDLLNAGVDIAIVQKLMGHESVDTTAGYDRRPAKAKIEAIDKLIIPT